MFPFWRADSRELFYVKPGPGGAALWSVSIKTEGSAIVFGTPQTTVHRRPRTFWRTIVVSRDGQRFLVARLVGGPGVTRALTVVLDWRQAARQASAVTYDFEVASAPLSKG